MGAKGGTKGEGFVFFSVFSGKRKRKWKKYFVHFVGNLLRIPKLFFFHSSIKTEEVLFFYTYIYTRLYIFVYISKKLSPKWKNFQEQKAFLFRLYILYENFSKIGSIIKKWGGKGGPQRVQIWLFSMLIFIIYSFIYLIHSYFQILLVCEECYVFVGGNIL